MNIKIQAVHLSNRTQSITLDSWKQNYKVLSMIHHKNLSAYTQQLNFCSLSCVPIFELRTTPVCYMSVHTEVKISLLSTRNFGLYVRSLKSGITLWYRATLTLLGQPQSIYVWPESYISSQTYSLYSSLIFVHL